jgi:hypothetical protein
VDEQPQVTPSEPSAPLTAPVKTEADAAVASGDQAAFKEARRAEKTPVAPKADSRSATSARQTASTEASSQEASEATDPTSPGKPRGNVKTRTAEVDGEIATLKARLAERDGLLARTREAPAAPVAPPVSERSLALPSELASYDAYLAAHPTASLEEFFDARSDARSELKEQRKVEAQREQQRTEAQTKAVDEFAKRVSATAEADPRFAEKVAPAVLNLKPVIALKPGEKAGPGNVIAQELISSPVAPQVMVALSDPEELARLMSMRNPAEIIRAVAKIEARFLGDDDAPAPPAFKTTTAPTPPTTLGRRPTDTLAPVEAAIRDGDMSAFKAAKNAERAARFGRR